MTLTSRDLIFAAINGALIGLLSPFIFTNLAIQLPVPIPIFVGILALLSVIGVATGYFLAQKVRPFFFQLAKFGLIGVANTVIDLGLFNLFIYFSDVTDGYLISVFKSFSVMAAIINSFIWNKFWSFEKKDVTNVGDEFTHFLAVSLTGLLINVGITSVMTNLIGAPAGFDPKVWANIAAAAASILVLTWNFVGYKFFVFKK